MRRGRKEAFWHRTEAEMARVRALTQDSIGGQYIKLHLLLETAAPELEAEGAGVLIIRDLKVHSKPFLFLTGS